MSFSMIEKNAPDYFELAFAAAKINAVKGRSTSSFFIVSSMVSCLPFSHPMSFSYPFYKPPDFALKLNLKDNKLRLLFYGKH